MTNKRTPPNTRLRNLGLAVIAGQAGCLTLTIVVVALFIGLWLDARFGQRGPFTFGLLFLSVPFSLYAMLRLTVGAISRIQPQPVQQQPEPPKSEED